MRKKRDKPDATCHPERPALTHSSGLCGPCYRHAYYERQKSKWRETYAPQWIAKPGNLEKRRAAYRKWYYKKRAEQRRSLGPERCGICGRKDVPLEMDHDHARYQIKSRSGWGSRVKYRGLLCGRCNTALAYIEDVAFRQKALRYLRRVKR